MTSPGRLGALLALAADTLTYVSTDCLGVYVILDFLDDGCLADAEHGLRQRTVPKRRFRRVNVLDVDNLTFRLASTMQIGANLQIDEDQLREVCGGTKLSSSSFSEVRCGMISAQVATSTYSTCSPSTQPLAGISSILQHELETLFGRPIDLVSKRFLRPRFAAKVLPAAEGSLQVRHEADFLADIVDYADEISPLVDGVSLAALSIMTCCAALLLTSCSLLVKLRLRFPTRCVSVIQMCPGLELLDFGTRLCTAISPRHSLVFSVPRCSCLNCESELPRSSRTSKPKFPTKSQQHLCRTNIDKVAAAS